MLICLKKKVLDIDNRIESEKYVFLIKKASILVGDLSAEEKKLSGEKERLEDLVKREKDKNENLISRLEFERKKKYLAPLVDNEKIMPEALFFVNDNKEDDNEDDFMSQLHRVIK